MVATRESTNLSLDKNVKKEARDIYKSLGFSLSDAVNAFLIQSIEKRGFPFELKLPSTPNKETQKILKESLEGKNLEPVTLEQLKEEWKKSRA